MIVKLVNMGTDIFVSPPTVNGRPVYIDGDEWRGKRSKGGQAAIHVLDALDDLVKEFHTLNYDWGRRAPLLATENVPSFVDWLVAKKKWTRPVMPKVLEYQVQ